MIVSMREIDAPDEKTAANMSGRVAADDRSESKGTPVRHYEITIRMQDGSTIVVDAVNPAKWRPRQRVVIIASTS